MSIPFDGFQQGLMTGQQFGAGLRQRRNAREIGGLMASGDVAGARAVAYGQGDIPTGQALDRQLSAQDQARAEQRTEALLGGIAYLRTIPPEQRPQAFTQMRGQLGAVFEPDMLDQLSGADMSDQSLAAFGAALGQEAERLQLFQQRGGDIVGVNPRTGQEASRINAPAEVFDPFEGAPQGFRWTDEQRSALQPIPGYIDGRQQISAAGRAPPRPRSSGGGSRPSGGSSAPRPSARPPWERF